jgi:hypothetical protein
MDIGSWPAQRASRQEQGVEAGYKSGSGRSAPMLPTPLTSSYDISVNAVCG